MLMQNYPKKARTKAGLLGSKRANKAESTILHNRIWETVEYNEGLLQLLTIIQQAYDFAEDRRDSSDSDDPGSVAFTAAESLNDQVTNLVDEIVAECCASILKDVTEGWMDVWTESEIEAARQEAKTWLDDHEDITARMELTVPGGEAA